MSKTNQPSQLSVDQRTLLALRNLRSKLNAIEQANKEPIAIIGIGCRFPGNAETPQTFWQLLSNQVDTITEVPPDRWDIEAYYDPDPDTLGKITTRYGGFVNLPKAFDSQFFNLSPREAMSLDPQQRLLLEVSWEALENAGLAASSLVGSQVGVFIGICSNEYYQQVISNGFESIDAYSGTGNAHSVASGRLSYIFGFTGPSLAVDTACSSSLVTVHLACQSLRQKECNLALAGGVNVLLSPDGSIIFSRLKALAPDGRCKTFDAAANGYVRGEGCGMVVLKRLSDAVADGDPIIAVIRSSAINQDGRSSGLTAPNGPSQEAVIRQALQNGGVEASEVSYVEAHGTGTPLGDPIEIQALATVYGKERSLQNPLLVGSVKTNVGHLEAAAGIVGVIKVALALQHQKIPPHLNLKTPNPHINWENIPIKVTTETVTWQNGEQPIAGAVSSFGISGTNAHIILQQTPEKAEVRKQKVEDDESLAIRPLHLLTLSAKTKEALVDLLARYEGYLRGNEEALLEDLCYTTNTGRSHFGYRIAITTKSTTDLLTKIKQAQVNQNIDGIIRSTNKATDKNEIAFLFTGHGSQYINMGRDLYETHPTFRQTINQCNQILENYLELSLLDVLYPGSQGRKVAGLQGGEVAGVQGNRVAGLQGGKVAEVQSSKATTLVDSEGVADHGPRTTDHGPRTTHHASRTTHHAPINDMRYAQPILFALQYALAQLWISWGINPDVVMGHSGGEYAAACIAGVFSLEDGLKLVAERGRLMETLPQAGQMMVVFATEETIKEVIAPYSDSVWISVINGPTNIVLSGLKETIAQLQVEFTSKNIKTKVLEISYGSHCPLIEPALAEFSQATQKVTYTPPKLKIISNITGQIIGEELATAEYWVQHLRQPVRFAQGVATLQAENINTLIEIGPKPTLLLIAERCLEETNHVPNLTFHASVNPKQSDWQQLLQSLAELYIKGVNIDWQGFNRNYAAKKIVLPTYPFQRQPYWIERNKNNGLGLNQALAKNTHHPLLGSKLTLAGKQTSFLSTLSPTQPSYLTDHQVFDTPVLPATAYLEMALAAGKQLLKQQPLGLKGINIQKALLLADEQLKTVQILLAKKQNEVTFEIYSLLDEEATNETNNEDSKWQLHCSGLINTTHQKQTTVQLNLAQLQTQCSKVIDVPTYYQQFQKQGITYGPTFQAIKQLWQGNDESLGQIELPPTLVSKSHVYQLHPVLLDACLQVFGAALATQNNQETYLPVAIEKLHLYSQIKNNVWCYVKPHVSSTRDAQTVTADLKIMDEEGTLLVEIIGLTVKQASRDVLLGTPKSVWQNWLYEVMWQPKARFGPAQPAIDLTSNRTIQTHLEAELNQKLAQTDLNNYPTMLHQLEKISVDYIIQALSQLGWQWQPNQSFTTDQIITQLKIINPHNRLLQRLLDILTEEDILQKLPQDWQLVNTPSQTPPKTQQQQLLKAYPAHQAEITLLGRCGDELSAVLCGAQDPVQVVFPGGDLSVTTQLYQDSPVAKIMNTLVQKAVLSALQQVSPTRGLRILEIGAGTGGTTAHILPHLPHHQVEYVFSDIGTGFINKAQEKFAAYNFITYKKLDIEQDPTQQDFIESHYDLVIAANVVHATTNLQQSLTHIHQLLVPNGLLILLEGTQKQRWLDLTFGLLEGWWKFNDHALRTDYPLLSSAQWLKVLTDCDFEQAIDITPPQEGLSTQSVIIARAKKAPLTVTDKVNHWLIFADEQGLGEKLASLIKTQNQTCNLVFAGNNYKEQQDKFVINPNNQTDFEKLWQCLLSDQNTNTPTFLMKGIIYLWGIDTVATQSLNEQTLALGLKQSCNNLLNLVQSLLKANPSSPPRLWLVSKGAVATSSTANNLSGLVQSPMWGMGKTIALEHPELKCVQIDLEASDVDISPDEAQQLFAEIWTADEEDQIALRANNRLVARLINSSLNKQLTTSAHQFDFSATKSYQLAITKRGLLDNLQWQATARRSPGPSQIEIEVRATGLNFIDLLNVLGELPIKVDHVGQECSGKVVSVGPDVTDLVVGDMVFGVASGSFARYITVDRRMVTKMESLTPIEAATIPVTFLTAYYSLHVLAQIKPGDKVLIHAATGGTGQAAVQIAQQAGAEVYGTASKWKWDTLKKLGVNHIYNSRNLDFAAEIMEDTNGTGIDIILNSLTSPGFIEKNLSVLAKSGRFLEIGKRNVWTKEEINHIRPDVTYWLADLATVIREQPDLIPQMWAALIPMFNQGLLKPLPNTVFNRENVIDAFRYMQQGKHTGKIIISQPADNKLAQTEETLGFKSEATYLITGGLGGLGLLVARWMVEKGAKHLLLIGRSGANEQAKKEIANLEKMGATIGVMSADVIKLDDLKQVLNYIEKSLPPLAGIIHSVGILADGVLKNQNWANFEQVLAPKVQGSWYLHQLTKDKPLDFFILFSSVASLLGSAGQANHVAANSFLDALAYYRQSLGLPALSINWGGWSEIGAFAERQITKPHYKKGMDTISPQAGLAVLDYLFWRKVPQIGVVPINWSQFASQVSEIAFFTKMLQQYRQKEATVITGNEFKTRLQATSEDERLALLSSYVQAETAKVLGWSPSHPLDPQQGFFEMGMDSLTAVELKNRLQTTLDCSLLTTVIFDYPSVVTLSTYLAQEVLNLESSPETDDELEIINDSPQVDGEQQNLSEDELQNLSEDELAALLMEKLSFAEGEMHE